MVLYGLDRTNVKTVIGSLLISRVSTVNGILNSFSWADGLTQIGIAKLNPISNLFWRLVGCETMILWLR